MTKYKRTITKNFRRITQPLVTNKFRIHSPLVEPFDEVSFTSGTSVTDSSKLLNTNMYLFIGKVTSWDDDQTPPTPTDLKYTLRKLET